MEQRISACRGCLLGLAVGDAMGYIVDERSWQEIREDYGPNGLLGYDMVNGCAAGSSYTQVAAYAANGLLLSITRGKPELTAGYINLALREWARAQHFPRDPERSWCWVAKLPQMRVRRCKDSRMLDALRLDTPGTPEKPQNRAATPGGLPAAVAVGLACGGRGLPRELAPQLGAQTVALTHGDAEAFLCGSVLAACISGILAEPEISLAQQWENAIGQLEAAFSGRFEQVQPLAEALRRALAMGQREQADSRAVMEELGCDNARQCLCGTVFATLQSTEDFDGAMILAVNHSGRSAAVGCLTGAVLGARMGGEALPEFYLECLEPAEMLEELSRDLALGSPTSGLFDDDWDHKYVQGLPLKKL